MFPWPALHPRAFNPSPGLGRFRPIRDAAGAVVPTAYGAADEETAVAEVVLRGVGRAPAATRRRLYRLELDGLAIVALRPHRSLTLARLHGLGLQRLGLRREEIVDTDEADYPGTAAWAQALHDCSARPQGLSWTSRQNDSSRALILFGDRLSPGELEVARGPLSLESGPGLELVRRVVHEAGVDLEA